MNKDINLHKDTYFGYYLSYDGKNIAIQEEGEAFEEGKDKYDYDNCATIIDIIKKGSMNCTNICAIDGVLDEYFLK